MNWGSWLDEYDREARLGPMLLTLLPIVFAAISFGLEHKPIVVLVIGTLVATGVPMVVAKQVADRGRAVERALFAKWGAPPTTLLLVPPVSEQMGDLVRQRRTRLEKASGITLPTGSGLTGSEKETYETAVRWLIENTRDHAKFPVVWEELKTYGFWRNALGLRPFGLLTSGAGFLIIAVGSLRADSAIWVPVILGGACGLAGLWWWRVPSEYRVRAAADRYAARILDASAVQR